MRSKIFVRKCDIFGISNPKLIRKNTGFHSTNVMQGSVIDANKETLFF